jgi:hypothetical protein
MRSLFITIYLLLVVPVNAQTLKTPRADGQDSGCSVTPPACEKPVKWLTDKNDCSCFACEYGKPGRQHTVCTKNKDAKFALLNLSLNGGMLLVSGPIKTFSGKIALHGGQVTLVDQAGMTWDILNADGFKRYAGRNVQLKARVNEEKRALEVTNFKATMEDREDKD